MSDDPICNEIVVRPFHFNIVGHLLASICNSDDAHWFGYEPWLTRTRHWIRYSSQLINSATERLDIVLFMMVDFKVTRAADSDQVIRVARKVRSCPNGYNVMDC